MHWRVKGAIQAVLGVVPRGAELHTLLQRRAGGLQRFESELSTKIDDALLMIGNLREVAMPVPGSRFVEIGSGWYPTLPFCLLAGGARSIVTFDLNRHLQLDLALRCARGIERRSNEIAAATGRDEATVRATLRPAIERLARGETIEAATEGAIVYRAPADARATTLPAASVDVVFSNDVLEHVPKPVLEGLFAEAFRIVRPGGIVFHAVNCGDHYAYGDRAIDQLNYLRYSEEAWAKWNNAFLWQNRLRGVDFTDLARAAGFAIELDTSRPHPKRLAELAKIRVASEFARYTPEELAITSISFVGRKPATAGAKEAS